MRFVVISLLICIAFSGYGRSIVSIEKVFYQSDITMTTFTYNTVDLSHPIAVWEEELGINRQWSHLIPYKRSVELKADMYRPRDSKVRPVFLIIHGGAFLPEVGSRQDGSMIKMAQEFAQRGYCVISIDYRVMSILAPSFIKGAYVAAQDAKAAVRYIANHADELRIDAKRIFIGGISAGAITAMNAVFLDQSDHLAGRQKKMDAMFGCLNCVGESQRKKYKIRGIINIAGGVYNTKQFWNNPAIPILNVHGDDDDIVPMRCGLPFDKYSNEYNLYLGKLENLARKLGLKMWVRELLEARINPMCGSEIIHKDMKSHGRKSYFLKVKKGNHYLVVAPNNILTSNGQKIVDTVSRFLYFYHNKNGYSNAMITGR